MLLIYGLSFGPGFLLPRLPQGWVWNLRGCSKVLLDCILTRSGPEPPCSPRLKSRLHWPQAICTKCLSLLPFSFSIAGTKFLPNCLVCLSPHSIRGRKINWRAFGDLTKPNHGRDRVPKGYWEETFH